MRGKDKITLTATVPQGAFRTDPGLPATDISFVWRSLSEAADAAGYSRRVTGIHWERSDLEGRILGRKVGTLVADKALALFDGDKDRNDRATTTIEAAGGQRRWPGAGPQPQAGCKYRARRAASAAGPRPSRCSR